MASGLLAGYLIALLSLFLLGADAPDVRIALVLIMVPWVAAPAAFAAWLVGTARDPIRSWGGLLLEAGVVGSTILVWFYLTRHPDPQNGLAFIWLPPLQFCCVGAGLAGLIYGQTLLGRARPSS